MSALVLAFTMHRDALLPLVKNMSKVVVKKDSHPILSNVLLRAEANGLVSVTSTDIDITAVASAEGVNVAIPGAICVHKDLFQDSLQKMPDAPVKIEVGDIWLTMSSGRSRAKCQTLPASDFPDVVYRGDVHSFTIPAVDLTTISDKVGFAISKEETRYYLNGIYMHAPDGALTAVATDGHRLSKLSLEPPEGAFGMPGVIVPRLATELFGLLAGKSDNPVEIEVTDAFIRFRTPRLSITSKLIDGTFPDYNRFIPRGNELKAKIAVAPLREAVERVGVYAIGKDRTVTWHFTPGLLRLSSSSKLGEAADEMEVDCDFELKIGFSAKYVTDFLESFKGSQIQFGFLDPSAPTMVLDLGDDRRELVLMPQKV
ncbi:DNA polymerase III subunit beta [Aureimonas sp. AU12]|uniref:DNA polymerase III subunit beta n=1 Tax=Aureimonas sp. AU12 TaxID=1638161 RepID=UPI0007822922|nr:DNA polymerase III subunit beta [Aureimonas sp. AU12]